MRRPALPTLTWKTRRSIKLWLEWFTFSLAAGFAAQGVANLQLAWLRGFDREFARSQLSGKLGMVGFLRNAPGAGWLINFVGEYPQGVFGFVIIGGLVTAALRGRFHDRFLASFNDDVLTRAGEADRPDRDEEPVLAFVQLGWTPGASGPRFGTWSGLKRWCAGIATTERRRGARRPLSLGVLTGRAGSGKSRMGYELARALARRDMLGGASPQAILGWRVGVFWRHAVLSRRRADDPWDAGLLVPKGERDYDHLCSVLAEWSPCRPTILLLDDPLRDLTGEIWRVLTDADRKRPFRHPVCLLVMNQTIPPDTKLEFNPESSRWDREGRAADPQPFLLPIEAWFTPTEATRVAFETQLLGSRSAAERKAIRETLPLATQGNPLLVELAVEWLQTHGDIGNMTSAGLIEARASRILKALEHHNVVDDSQLAALALATLSGGVPGQAVAAEVKRLFETPVPLPSFATLRACFPSDPLSPEDGLRIPAVRPDMVGDAFIDLVLRRLGTNRAAAMAEAGFRLNAAHIVRNLRRARPAGSAMTKAIATIDPTTIAGADVVTLALGFADVAAICQPDDRPQSTSADRAAWLADALRIVERLDTAQRRRFCVEFLSFCTIPAGLRGQRQVRPGAAMRIMMEAAAGAEVAAETWIGLFDVLRLRAEGELGPVDGLVSAAAGVVATSDERFTNAAWMLGEPWRPALAPVFSRMAEVRAGEGLPLRAARLAAMAAIETPQEVRLAADRALQLLPADSSDPEAHHDAAAARRYEAYAWSIVPAGANALESREAADAVAAIAERFPGDVVIGEQAAIARRHESYAWCQVPLEANALEAQAAADLVTVITGRFPNDPLLQVVAASARRNECYAWCQIPLGEKAMEAREAADIVAAIAKLFRDDAEFQRLAAAARHHEGYAWATVPLGAKAKDARDAAESVAAIAARFPDDPIIQGNAVGSRANEGAAWVGVPLGVMASEARAAADSAAAIAARFPDDIGIQRLAAQAWCNEAGAWSNVTAGAKARETRAAADAAAGIAARFADDPVIQADAARARVSESVALARVPAGGSAQDAHAVGDIVAAIAACFPNHILIQVQAANARSNEAAAWSEVPAGAKARESRAAADSAAVVAARFPDDVTVQHQAACARSNECAAWARVPAGAKALDAEAAADIVAGIAARFADNSAVQGEVARARRNASSAWSNVPSGAKANEVRAIADALAEIAEHFPNDPAIREHAAGSRCNEAHAWSQAPMGSRALDARRAANATAATAVDFENNAAIQCRVAVARRCEAYAWSQVPGRANALEVRAAAALVTAIARRLPDDTAIQAEADTVRQLLLQLE